MRLCQLGIKGIFNFSKALLMTIGFKEVAFSGNTVVTAGYKFKNELLLVDHVKIAKCRYISQMCFQMFINCNAVCALKSQSNNPI